MIVCRLCGEIEEPSYGADLGSPGHLAIVELDADLRQITYTPVEMVRGWPDTDDVRPLAENQDLEDC